jgi:hypothetical protein
VNRPAAVALVVLAVLLAWALMYLGWRARVRRQGGLPVPPPPPPGLSERADRDGVEATYVSTTRAADWLDRVAVHGLGVRSSARVLVAPEGVLVTRGGAPDVFTPAADLSAARRETFRAGKAVPGSGLVVWDWSLGDTLVTTAVHVRHDAEREALQAAVAALAGPGTAGGTRHEEEDHS